MAAGQSRVDVLGMVDGLCCVDPGRRLLGYVYFLTEAGGEVVYVGKTVNLDSRIKNHRCVGDKPVDDVYAVAVPIWILPDAEAFFISILRPRDNDRNPRCRKIGFAYCCNVFFRGDEKLVRKLQRSEPVDRSTAIKPGWLYGLPHIDRARVLIPYYRPDGPESDAVVLPFNTRLAGIADDRRKAVANVV